MKNGITIGQYYPGNSLLHRTDARIKLVLTMIFWSLGLTALFLFAGVLISRVPLKMLLRSLKTVAVIVIITAVLNLFYSSGGEVLVSFWKIKITDKGLFTASFMAIRIICLILGSSLMTFTTTPTELTDGIERLLSPLKVFHIQVHTLAMMMTLALRFIPTLADEIEKITNAQKARGADFSEGSLISRAKALIPVLVPLFVSSFRRAYELAFAMECRCYTGGESRTRMKQMKIKPLDYLFILGCALLVGGTITLNMVFPHVL